MKVSLYYYLLLLTKLDMNRQNFRIFHNSMIKLFLLKSLYGIFVLNYSIVIYPLSYITGKVIILSITDLISTGSFNYLLTLSLFTIIPNFILTIFF